MGDRACTACGEAGHNRRTCGNPPKAKADKLVIWLPAEVSGQVVSGFLGVLACYGYEANIELSTYGRGRKMRIIGTKRVYATDEVIVTTSYEVGD